MLPGAQTPANLESDPRRQAIVHSALRRFIAEGYAGTRMGPIAQAAGVSTATLYGYFPGKAELFAAIIADAADDFLHRLKRIDVESGPLAQQLPAFATAYADFISDPFVRAILRLAVAERPRFPEVAVRLFERSRTELGGTLVSILRKMAAEGVIRTPKPAWAAGQLMGMIEHPLLSVPLMDGARACRRTPHQIAEDAVETFLARFGV